MTTNCRFGTAGWAIGSFGLTDSVYEDFTNDRCQIMWVFLESGGPREMINWHCSLSNFDNENA